MGACDWIGLRRGGAGWMKTSGRRPAQPTHNHHHHYPTTHTHTPIHTPPPHTHDAAWRESEGQTAEQATKVQALRRVFHRAVLVPVDNLDELWRVRAGVFCVCGYIGVCVYISVCVCV